MNLLDQPGLEIALANLDREATEIERLRAGLLVITDVIRKARDMIRAGQASDAEKKMSEFLQAFDFRVAPKPPGKEH